MLIPILCILSVIIAVHGVTEDGFSSNCSSNATLFVKKGEVATFHFANSIGNQHNLFYRGILNRKLLLNATLKGPDTLDTTFSNTRAYFTITGNNTGTVTLQDVVIEDTGMYMVTEYIVSFLRLVPLLLPRIALNRTYTKNYCWELFVLDIWNPQGIQTFEEYRPAYIHATPPASRLVRPRVNATATWLLNGLNYSETTAFLNEDGFILIASMPRHMNAKDVTYRIVEDNGNIHKVQLTLSVTYGPDPYLRFSPAETFYTLTKGDMLPDITCSTDCNPTCQITWDRSGVGNVLSLGQVDRSSSGIYTCQATRNGSDVTVERSIYVEVTGLYVDNTSFIIAVAVLGAILGMTLICLGICAAWMCRTSGRNGTCKSEKDAHIARTNRTNQNVNGQRISNVELDHYENTGRTLM